MGRDKDYDKAEPNGDYCVHFFSRVPRFAEKLNVTSSVPDLYNHKHVCNATATRLKGVLAPKMMSMLVAAPIVTDNNKSDDMTLTEYKGE